MSNDAAKVSIIVISYNTADMTLKALETLYDTTAETSFEVIVLDNASTDNSADRIEEAFPQAKLIRSAENLGFAAGNNEAAKHAQSEWILLLNPDTECQESAVDNLMKFADAFPNAGIYGGRTIFADGSLNPTSCWRFMTPWSLFAQSIGLAAAFRSSNWINWESYGGWKRDAIREVEIITGCFFLIRRELWEELGGFDLRFFMYAEEADLCYRVHKLGLKALFTPDATIVHHGGASEPVRSDKLVRLLKAKVQFLHKHWTLGAATIGEWLFQLHVLFRIFCFSTISLISNSNHHRTSKSVWKEIWCRRREWLAVS